MNLKTLLTIAIGAGGVFLVASDIHQSRLGFNWFGQFCGSREICVHPEWIAIGAAILYVAYLIFRAPRK